MAKTRISISVEKDQADRIRRHAERAGLDVSAYLVLAAGRQMAETEAVEAQFAGVDALIAEAQAEAEAMPPGALEHVGELTEQERLEVEAALALVYGEDQSGSRPGEAA
ncbi:hypothetical protein [Streptomyces lichenis]|uniref:Ribbon-helix-helix protein, CopG family n=1 Tax=Streptomyces lichenis TaxID=2306967 RepID=A0ABT0II95_9ACTN|nr:hypothetical protein [Streptomyces lichenis]MCK8681052.1 hypothetical protein [Streptomyces lichenis]